MEIRKVLTLRGPNLWANFPVIEAWVDLGRFEDFPSNTIPGFNERLTNWLPTMIEHRCTIGERGGFFQRLSDGTWLGHILEHVTLELQTLAGTPVGFGKARETSERGVYRVVVEYKDESVARECLGAAHRLLMAAIHDESFDVTAEIERLREFNHQVCLGPSTRAIVDAAVAQGIPWRRMNSDSLIQFGQGVKQRRIMAAETDRTGAIAEAIAQDKELTRMFLQGVGAPVPVGRSVVSAEDAWAAAEKIGFPVVVKPQDGNQGRGVATNLTTRDQVIAAYEAARIESSTVIVERFAPGNDYRLLVIAGRLVAAAQREPAHVVGDGIHTIAELIDRANMDPRRSDHHATVLSKLRLDTVSMGVLREQGVTPATIPPGGTVVLIRRNANLSTGGTATDVTDRVHPQVAERAIEAARVVGLDIAGIDVVAKDISKPLEEQQGIIVEVNAAPGLRMHLQPSAGQPRPVGEAIVNMLYPQGDDGRIPIVAITGTNGKTTTTRFIAHILKGTGKQVGMTCTDGIYIDDRRVDSDDCSGPQSARSVLLNPAVEMAVFETARGGILREGLGFDRCDVAVVTNIGEGDHLGLADIVDLEMLAKVKRCIVDVVKPSGTAVLNAADPHTVAMAEYCPGQAVFFATDEHHPVLAAHRAAGKRAVFVRENVVILAVGLQEESLLSLDRAPLTHGGRIAFQVENTLATVAAVWALGIPLDVIRTRIESFAANMEMVPGRFNLVDVSGATVVLDYGHNASSLRSLIEVAGQYPHQHRTAVYSMAGDRRDCDLVRVGELLGDAFDRVILYEDHSVRGRGDGEIIRLMREGLARGSRTTEVEEVRGAVNAVEAGLKYAQPGEFVLIQADTIDESVHFFRRYLTNLNSRPRKEPALTSVAGE